MSGMKFSDRTNEENRNVRKSPSNLFSEPIGNSECPVTLELILGIIFVVIFRKTLLRNALIPMFC